MDKVTAFIAWWGAIISTTVLVWDVYKWHVSRRPHLVIWARGEFVEPVAPNSQKFIAVKVVNVGDKPTTLSLITFRFYKTKPKRWPFQKRRADQRGFIRRFHSQKAPLPQKLDQGDEWLGWIEQTPEFEDMARTGYLFFEAEDSSTFDARKNARTRFMLGTD